MKISVIISTYNQPCYLDLVLKSLSNQININFNDYEVIIADDGSSNDTELIISAYKSNFPFKFLHVWHNDYGFRKAHILNKSVAASTGDYLIFIDGDCIVSEDFLYGHAKMAEVGFFIAGNRVLLSKDFTSEIVEKNINLHNITKLKWLFLYLNSSVNKLSHWIRLSYNGKFRKLRSDNWKYPKGCNISLWKDSYIAINGYDESFSGWGHEDADFFIRLLHFGIKIKDGRLAVPVYHLWHKFNDRSNEQSNLKLLYSRVVDDNFIKAIDGIDKYLH